MKKTTSKIVLGVLISSIFLGSCKDDTPDNPIVDEGSSKYVLMTVTDRTQQNGGGYISAYDQFPTGTFSNVIGGKSLQGSRGMAGWRTYGNSIFKMYRGADAVQGIEKIEVSADGTVTTGKFISSKNPTEALKYTGTGNFVIQNETSGFYWDVAEPLKIQKFNPSTMTNTGSALDFGTAVNANISEADAPKILFKAIGQKFLAIKGGKLYANITYAKTNTTQAGFFDDYFADIYIAVIDIATGNHEKTIKIADAGSIAYINDNPMYDFDTNGDLYIVTQGLSALGGKSKIVRIKANETEVDNTWACKFADFRAEDNGKFVGVHAKNGTLIVTLNTQTLTGGPTGNINNADIWKFYTISTTTPTIFTPIEGIPTGVNPGAALAVVEVDNKVLLRGASAAGANGYYEYNYSTKTATKLFEVNEGGTLTGFVKIDIKK